MVRSMRISEHWYLLSLATVLPSIGSGRPSQMGLLQLEWIRRALTDSCRWKVERRRERFGQYSTGG